MLLPLPLALALAEPLLPPVHGLWNPRCKGGDDIGEAGGAGAGAGTGTGTGAVVVVVVVVVCRLPFRCPWPLVGPSYTCCWWCCCC